MPSRQGQTSLRPHPCLVRSALLAISLFCLLAFATVTSSKSTKTVLETLSSEPRFSSLVRALQATNLVSYLERRTTTGVTVFAPTNKAFEDRDGTWQDVNREILQYHILPSTVPVKKLADNHLLETSLQGPLGVDGPGQRVKVSRDTNNRIFIGTARVVDGDLVADNGVVHVVDSLLAIPVNLAKTLTEKENTGILNNAIEISGLTDKLSSNLPFTIFAPVDRAFDQLPQMTKQYLSSKFAKDDLRNILEHHTHEGAYYIAELPEGKTELPTLSDSTRELNKARKGGEVTYDGVVIEKADIIASNGVIHLIPRILLPPSFKMDTVKYLISMDRTKFVELFMNAGVSDYLTNQSPASPITIFTVPNEALEESPRPPKDQLLYHIIPGRYEFDDFQDNSLLHTASKPKGFCGRSQVVQVMVSGNKGEREVRINDAKILGDPVIVDGAIIYTLSRLIDLPVDPLQAIATDHDLSTFSTAVHTAKLDRTVRHLECTTMFVPSNQAFAKDSAVMSYLLLPEKTEELRAVLEYHIATRVVYSNGLPGLGKGPTMLPITTLAQQNITVTSGKNKGDLALQGNQPHDAQFQNCPPHDRPTSRGNLFVIDRVLLPDIGITVRSLLEGLNAPTFAGLLSDHLNADSEVPPLDSSHCEPFTLLVPSEEAFAHVDMEELASDPSSLMCSIKSQFVRGSAELVDGAIWKTLCANGWVKVHSGGDDEWELEIADKAGNTIGRAHVGRRGEAQNGNVYEVDRFFAIPVPRGIAWYWILLGAISALSLVAATFAMWRYVQVRKRRSGYEEVPNRD